MSERVSDRIDEEVAKIRKCDNPKDRLEGLLYVLAKLATEVDVLYKKNAQQVEEIRKLRKIFNDTE